MLQAIEREKEAIIKTERIDNCLILTTGNGKLRLCPKTADIIRITFTKWNDFAGTGKPGIIFSDILENWDFIETGTEVILSTKTLNVIVNKQTASLCFKNKKGKVLAQERYEHSRTFEEYDAYKLLKNAEVKKEIIDTPDGKKQIIREAPKEFDRKLLRYRVYFEWEEDEALYGLGQHEEGNLNLRGKTIYLHQANMKIPIPLLVSSYGYGILLDTYAPVIFNDNESGSYLYAEADMEIDYYFIYGGNLDGVIHGYRTLTGKATMLPQWAYGFIQSQEKYDTAEEMVQTVKEYRKRKIGLDCIVLDWCSWKSDLFAGEKILDPDRFPDPAGFIEELHSENVHFMISVWPNMDERSVEYQEFYEKDLLLPYINIYNALSPEARNIYWRQAKDHLFDYGVDAWWCDSSELFTPEWEHQQKPEPAIMYNEFLAVAQKHLPACLCNAYPLFHAMTIYEGQRTTTGEKRVVNLTRSSYIGQQRYGTILWSGDIAASWDTLRRQIISGLNFCASGLPYWTLDIGAFFVKPGTPWFWDGKYSKGCEDLAYRELYTRWYQYACFLPIFRAHGTDTRRELWNYGDKGSVFYEAMVKTNQLRYQLLPYIYSCAGKVWKDDATIMKMLAFDFPDDKRAQTVNDQYMFGEYLLICPVTEAMYYQADGCPLSSTNKTRKVYLPKGTGWYDFWTNKFYDGGQEVEAEAPIDRIPIFVKEGSILPMGEVIQFAEQANMPFTFLVYSGADANYQLYQDEGDGYGYEKGEYTLVNLQWQDKTGEFTISPKEAEVSFADYRLKIIRKS